MARGWESKSVEEQIGVAEAKKDTRNKQVLTTSEIEQRRRREGLLMDRARILRQLEGARNERYRALLNLTLEHVEAELVRFDVSSSRE